MLLAQITDTHIVERGKLLYGHVDTAEMLSSAVAHINDLAIRPDVILATGDMADSGRPAQYEVLAEILDDLQAPLVIIPGNHDDRAALRDAFPQLAGTDREPIDFVNDKWPLRLVGLDTTIPGPESGGRIRPEQMTWLDRVLGAEPDRVTLILQHHPPFKTGIGWMDAVGLSDAHLEADVVSRHDNVVGIVCGHLHRVINAGFAGTVASTWPSTGAQVALTFDDVPNGYTSEPPAVALHLWDEDDGLVSHVSYVDGPPTWSPSAR